MFLICPWQSVCIENKMFVVFLVSLFIITGVVAKQHNMPEETTSMNMPNMSLTIV